MFGDINMEYTVTFSWDDESCVWIATSEEITGLVLESNNFDTLVERVRLAVPELLSLNNQPPASSINCQVKDRQLMYD